MTFDDSPQPETLTARDIVNGWAAENLELIIRTYGEERFAKRIAAEIVAARERKSIESSKELAGVIAAAVPERYRRGRINPATRTFQALRIAVNDELRALSEGLERGLHALRPNGRMAVIAFHSLEDRIVKRTFREWARDDKVKLLTKKAIIPGPAETAHNPRARSAKLRGIEKNAKTLP
jgi:16S rRNA (cytosine1402-N4)-methyltransferase